MKFILFVEGYTERALPQFLKRWLDPQLTQPVGVKIVRFDGWQHYAKEIAKKVQLNLSGRSGGDVIAAIGLLDLYGPTFYPPDLTSVADRFAWAKRSLEDQVANPRFRQHFAVHEVEAWLLAEPGILPLDVRSGLPGRCAQPETVNFAEPPSKLLQRLYSDRLGRDYRKVIDGTNLFEALDPAEAYGRCPYLSALLDDLRECARRAEL